MCVVKDRDNSNLYKFMRTLCTKKEDNIHVVYILEEDKENYNKGNP